MNLNQAQRLNALTATGTDAEIVAVWNAPKTELKFRMVDYPAMANLIGFERKTQVLETLIDSPSAAFRSIHYMLAGRGIDMGIQQTRDLMPQFVLAGVLTQPEADTLLAEGVTVSPSNAVAILGRDAVEADVAAMRAWLEREATLTAFDDAIAAARNAKINEAWASMDAPMPDAAKLAAAINALTALAEQA